ncbi:type 1 glutamine amidotransferase domain-containing protein [Cetobacterium somerae]|jgi:putative intracellular protease/amidase|uniref:type 1 glutamine amidotransferase domain-containing protein n=1 Tax=Cetobacterium somerae TaxID=188913 RepID=UPI003D7671FC
MKKILMVVTSHDSLGNTGKKTGIWLSEFTEPYFGFLDNNVEIVIASPKGGTTPIDPNSLKEEALNESTNRYLNLENKVLEHTVSLEKINFQEFDGIFYPGGHGPMWDLSEDEKNAELVSNFYNSGKIVAAVCHGPAALIKGKKASGESLLKNKKVTGFSNLEEKAVNLEKVVPFLLEDKLTELSNNHYEKTDVLFAPYIIQDGFLLTGQNPASALPLVEKFLELLK